MLYTAVCAVGLSRVAHRPAVQDDTVAEIRRVLRREDLAKLLLDFHRVLEVIHEGLVAELRELLGDENVVLK